MDYLGWELERQRAALRALLGGGEAEEEVSGEKSPAWEEFSGWEEKAPAGGTRRSSESPGRARRRGSGRTGRYAAGRGEAGGPLVGAPGAWEMVREANQGALAGKSDGPEPPVSAWEAASGKEAETRERRGAETGASPLSRRSAETARAPRIGTGGAARPESSGGDDEAERETAAETDTAPEAPGGRRSGGEFAAGEDLASLDRGEAGTDFPGGAAAGTNFSGGAAAETAGRGEPLSRTLPWGGGWESAALRAEDGARALSRAVQRDARRYDGGFTIY